jgi:hypothetical protein
MDQSTVSSWLNDLPEPTRHEVLSRARKRMVSTTRDRLFIAAGILGSIALGVAISQIPALVSYPSATSRTVFSTVGLFTSIFLGIGIANRKLHQTIAQIVKEKDLHPPTPPQDHLKRQ